MPQNLTTSGMSQSHERLMTGVNVVFTSFFALEMLVKIIGLRGVRNYLRDPMNRFDGLLVVSCGDMMICGLMT